MPSQLINGAIKFMEENFAEHAELFGTLANHQKPHTLFIGCSDSRVVPSLITSTLPGELFVVRNIANVVPPYRISEEFLATTSAIEYALYSLNIKNIIVCGHSNCGGCAALFYDAKKLEKIPNVRRWLNLMQPVKDEVEKLKDLGADKREWITERLNIINSMQNLLSFPGIKDAYKNGEIKIYGWHYVIETGELFNYDDEGAHFTLLNKGMDYEKIYNQLFND